MFAKGDANGNVPLVDLRPGADTNGYEDDIEEDYSMMRQSEAERNAKIKK